MNEIKTSDDMNVIEMNKYMLADVRKEDIKDNSLQLALSTIENLSPILAPTVDKVKKITSGKTATEAGKMLYKVTNLKNGDKLKPGKGGKNFVGAIKKAGGGSTMANMKAVDPASLVNVTELDPTMLMVAVVLNGIERDLREIRENTANILSFLEHDKEAGIEADVEILTKTLEDLKYNFNDEKYRYNKLNQILDIERSAKKNMIFYKKEIKDELNKQKIITTNMSMNSMLKNIQNKFKYYRLSLYTYSFSTLMEVLLINDVQSDFLILRRGELDKLDKEYTEDFNKALAYVRISADKSLEGNALNGLGSAGKVLGDLAEIVKVKKVSEFLSKNGDNIKKSGQDLKENFAIQFNEMKDTKSKVFIKQIEQIDLVYNKTKNIFFDNEFLYLEPAK